MAISADGVDALRRLASTEPPLYLSPSPDLSQAARLASLQLFSSLKPYTTKSPLDRLLVDGFDAEQIWQQIDLQTQSLIPHLRREVNKLEKNPENLFGAVGVGKPAKESKAKEIEKNDEDSDDTSEDDEEETEIEGEEEEEDSANEGDEPRGVEDKFLKIKELEEYMEDDEAREYGSIKKKIAKRVTIEDEEGDNDEEDEELGLYGIDDEEEDKMANARYDDFFGAKKKTGEKTKHKLIEVDEEDDDMNYGTQKKTGQKSKPKLVKVDEDSELGDDEDDDTDFRDQKMNEPLSTHEKKLEKQRAKIEEMEKANLETKTWTMQGEVTAAKRPKNSALEVDLDFQRNVKPAPLITEEVTQSLEDMIMKRISEGQFDDIHRAPSLPSKAPREAKELDENKSKKGLGEIYADEYVQKTGLVSAALSFSDEQKKEASGLFKILCLKLDALSHFHFTPKPVIEDMSIQVNVPALAMEEIAPLAVSDAAMLAPEEVFAGKGDIKEEAELTQAERKRRRANKKRKFKAKTENIMAAKKARETTLPKVDGKEESDFPQGDIDKRTRAPTYQKKGTRAPTYQKKGTLAP